MRISDLTPRELAQYDQHMRAARADLDAYAGIVRTARSQLGEGTAQLRVLVAMVSLARLDPAYAASLLTVAVGRLAGEPISEDFDAVAAACEAFLAAYGDPAADTRALRDLAEHLRIATAA